MPEFLNLVSSTEASETLFRHLPPPHPVEEIIATTSALGRVTVCPVLSPEASPAFSRSTVDGFALQARDTYGASDSQPMYFNIIGEVPDQFNISVFKLRGNHRHGIPYAVVDFK